MSRDVSLAEACDGLDAIEYCFDKGWTDGLPVVPPTRTLVDDYLRDAGWDADEVILHEPVRGLSVVAEQVVANAVMAGCRREYLPVLRAALEAAAHPEYMLHGTITSTGGAAAYIVVNGPIRDEIGLNSGSNLFGPGSRANSTIGRAFRLVLLNCLSAQPGVLDRSTQGNFGKFSGCFAEAEQNSPWEPFHTTRGLAASDSAVTVFAGESGHNVLVHGQQSPEALLGVFADTMRAWGSFSEGESLIVMAPEHAHYLAERGWTRAQVQEFLYEHAARPIDEFLSSGKHEGNSEGGAELAIDGAIHRGRSAGDILIVVGGGDAGGHSCFFPSWSRIRGSIARTELVSSPARAAHL